jgi:hypothetical protein
VYFCWTQDTIFRLAIFGMNHQVESALIGESEGEDYPRLFVNPNDADRYAKNCSALSTRYMLCAKFILEFESDNYSERGFFLCKDEMSCCPRYIIKYTRIDE